MKFLIIIPARMKSSRLPGKPLINLKGKSMIERTFLQCRKVVSLKNIFVATEDKEILDHCKKKKIPCLMTKKGAKTGTDRVIEIAKKIKSQIYINLQGDEPIFSPKDLRKFLNISVKNLNNIIIGHTRIKSKKDYFSKDTVKIVFNKKNYAMYLSRAPIPSNKNNLFKDAYRQIGIYSYPRKELLNIKNKKTYFEKFEDIEIIRFMENGKRIKTVALSDHSISVDTKKDVREVLKKLR